MGLVLDTAPLTEPISLVRAKAHMRVEVPDDNDIIDGYIRSAREWAEGFTHRKLINQTWTLTTTQFPTGHDLWELPFGKTQQVIGISYVDSGGNTVNLTGPSTSPAGTDWQEDLTSDNGGIIAPSFGATWPVARDHTLGALTITFVAGYGEDGEDVPEDLLTAILFKIGDLYEVRSVADLAVPTFGTDPDAKLIDAARALANPFIIKRWAF